MRIYKTDENEGVAMTMYNIALQLSRLGKYQEALEQYENVLGKANQQQAQLILFEYTFPVRGRSVEAHLLTNM